MPFGSSNRVALRYVEESTWGTTPASPTLTPLRITGESLSFKAEFTESEEIRSDRMTPDTVLTSGTAEGDISGQLSYATFDDMFEAAFFGAWAATGSTVSAATDISITKTSGTPNTWVLGSSSTDFSNKSWTVGQFIKVAGFSPAGTFYAEITSIAAHSLGICPMTNVASDAAGDSVTITPLNFLRNGTTKTPFTFQKGFTDLTAPEYWNFTGSVLGGFELDIQTGSIATVSFSVKCKDAQMTETQFSSATLGTANTNELINAGDNISAIVFDGDPGASAVYFDKLNIKLDNALRVQNAVGTVDAIGIEPGSVKITGGFDLYFENSAQYDKFRAYTAFKFTAMVEDNAGQRYIICVPRAKFTSMEIAAGGLDKDIIASAEFTAIINTAGTYQIQLSRSAS